MRTYEIISAQCTRFVGVHRTRGVWMPSPPDRRFNMVLSRITYSLRPAYRGLFRLPRRQLLGDSEPTLHPGQASCWLELQSMSPTGRQCWRAACHVEPSIERCRQTVFPNVGGLEWFATHCTAQWHEQWRITVNCNPVKLFKGALSNSLKVQ